MYCFNRVMLAVLLAASMFVSHAAAAPQAGPQSALEQSLRLQIMAQRQAKLFLQLRMSVDAETSQRKLDEAVRAFDQALAQLAQSKGPSGAPPNLETIFALWSGARNTLGEAADPATTARAAREAEQLTQALAKLSAQMLPAKPSPALQLTLLAARDAMLAHRLAKLYLQLRGGDGDTERRNELAQARKDFLQAVDAMEQSPLSQGQIRANINLVRQQWAFFDGAISSSSVENKVLKVVVTTSERLGQSLTDIAGAYGQLAGGEQMLAQTTP